MNVARRCGAQKNGGQRAHALRSLDGAIAATPPHDEKMRAPGCRPGASILWRIVYNEVTDGRLLKRREKVSRHEKAKQRLAALPADYTYSEARTLLLRLGFEEDTGAAGSRVRFYRAADQRGILLHKPHPGDVMAFAAIRSLAAFLRELGELQ